MSTRWQKRLSWLLYSVPAGTLWLSLNTQSTQMAARESVLIIGAGAAGLAAAQHLIKHGYIVTILEARDRVGGRIWTDYGMAPHPVELGAEFIHGSGVVTWKLLKKYHLHTIPAIRDKFIYTALNGKVGKFDKLIPEDWEDDIWELAEKWVGDGGDDVSIRTLLDSEQLLQPPNDERTRLINNLYSCDYGADLISLSTHGLLEASYENDADEDGDFRIIEGYGQLIDKLAEGMDIRYKTAVSRINYDESGVQIYDAHGTEYRTNRAIITLPLGVLQSDSVTFTPQLPTDKTRAIQHIGAAKVNKLILKFNKPFWKKKMSMLYTALDSQIWWRPGWGHEHEDEAHILTALIGGASGERYSQMSEADAIQAGLADLQQLFGAVVKKFFDSGCFINWGADPYSRMGYSYNAVGGTGLRKILAAPVDNKLFFAGEATNTIRPATVHGAIESGYRAADELIAAVHTRSKRDKV